MAPSKTVYKTGNLSGNPKLMVDVIASGRGNSILVSYPNGNFMLVDCGSQAYGTNNKKFKHVSQYITSVTGGNNINCVVLTHGDRDHTAWIPSIPEAQHPRTVFYGGKRKDLDAGTLAWVRAQEKRPNGSVTVWQFTNEYHHSYPDADFQGADSETHDTGVYVLSAGAGDSPNSRSVVLLLIYGNFGILLPGDATMGTEDEILSNFSAQFLSKSTILVPGHHGALESTGETFQDTLAPDAALISASGTNLSYAHPNCTTLNQLTAADYIKKGTSHSINCSGGKGLPYSSNQSQKCVYLTGTNGDLRFTTDGTNYNIKVSSLG